jgi:DNA-directed RNA polymerase alpha subunit
MRDPKTHSFLQQIIVTLDDYIIDELSRDLGFGRTTWKLHKAGIQLVGHLTSMQPHELVRVRGIGPKTVQRIEASLFDRGLHLGMQNTLWKEHRHHLAKHVFH